MTPSRIVGIALTIVAVAASGMGARAQTTSASLSGSVSGPGGGPVAGALVQARSAETGLVRTTSTGPDGVYRIDTIPPGEWTVVARGPDGTLSESRTLNLRLQQAGRVDLTLGAGFVEEVTVQAKSPLVDPQRTGGELRVAGAQTEVLPIAGRNVTDLALLDASVRAAPAGNFYGERGSVFVINGQSGRSNSFLVDGLDNNDQASGTTLNAWFSPQVIGEFVVLTHQYRAEFGRASGGILNIVTARGGNERRFDGFAQLASSRWNFAGDLVSSLPESGGPTAAAGWQSGVTASGPIRKDKAFYFIAYEHQSSDEVVPYTGTGRDGVAGGRFLAPGRDDNIFVRTDFNLDASNVLMVRLSADDRTTRGLNVGGVFTPESGFRVDERDLQLAASLTSVISPGATNEMRLLLGSSSFDQLANSSRPGATRPSGIFGGNNLTRQRRGEERLQLVENLTWRAGDHALKAGFDVTKSKTRVEALFNPNGNFLYETDAPLEPGDCGDIIASQVVFYCTGDPSRRCLRDSDCYGLGICDVQPIDCPGQPGVDDDGDGLVDEAGRIETYPLVYQLIFGEPRATLDDTRVGLFVQDSWQITPRVLVDYGLRYDLSTFRLPASARVETTIPNGGAGRDHDNVAPRLGFTWSPRGDGRIVVRGGAGVFYDKLVLAFPAVASITSGTKIGLYFPMGTTVELTEDLVEELGPDVIRQVLQFPDYLVLRFSTGTRLDTPYANQFNFGVEGMAGRSGAWSANLVRALGYRQPLMKDLNPIVSTYNERGEPQHRVFGVGSIAAVVTEGRSWYTGVELGWKWQGEGSWHSISYTWSRSEDLGPDPLKGGIYLPPRPPTLDPGSEFESFAFERGRSDHDRRHRIVAAGEAPLPWMGLRASAVAQFMSAAPFTVTTGRDDNVDGITTDRPAGVGRNASEESPLDEVNALRARIGLAPVTNLRAPSFFQVDVRLARPFRLGGSENTGQGYVQIFNLFNRFNGGPIEGRAISRDFGRPIGQVGPPRGIEFGLKFSI